MISRRRFLQSSAAASSALILPGHVLGLNGAKPPSEQLNIAGIGIGGQGALRSRRVESENIVALCDVDADYAGRTFKRYPKAKRYTDYRKMLDEQKDIDAVVIATPDHTHACIAMAAMKARQARVLRKAAHAFGVGGAATGAGRARTQSRHANGQSGPGLRSTRAGCAK